MAVYRYRFHRKIYYYFRITIDGKQLSRRLDKGKRFHSEEEARLVERRYILSNFNRSITKNDYVYLLSDGFINYLNDKYSEGTVYSFVGIWKRFFLEELSNYKLNDLNDSVFIELNSKINSLPINDKHQYISVAKNFLKFLQRYKIVISESIFFQSRKKEIFTFKKIEYWTFDEFCKFIKVIDDVFYKLLFSVLYYYGLRIGELRAIRKENFTDKVLIIDSSIHNKTLKKGQIISKTKTYSSNRQFPMLNHIYKLYLDYLLICDNTSFFVFSSYQDSKVIGETTIRRKLLYYCKLSGVKYIHPHCFRHSCASLLINNGMDYMQVSSWLGHSSPGVTLKTYSHIFETKKNDIYKMLNSLSDH